MEKNQVIDIAITGMSAEGSGVGHHEGMAVFVPMTAVGDEIRCRVVKVEKRLAYGIVEELVTPSPDRVEPECPVFGKCGGCVYRHVSYEAELGYKWRRVADALERIGGLDVVPAPIMGSPAHERYRNKAQVPVSPGAYRLMMGFYAPRSHRVVETRDCLLQPEGFAAVLEAVRRWGKRAGAEAYDEASGKGLLRHVYMRWAESTGEAMVCLVCTSGKLPEQELLVTLLRAALPGLVGVVVNLNPARTNVILGERAFVLWGRDHVVDELCGLRFRLSAGSFYQVNRRAAEVLYRLAAEAAALTGTETVLDLYCGTGTIGLSMADRAGAVIGIECVEAAVADAADNARANGIDNARFICADASEGVERLLAEGVRVDVAVVDPPRKGCAPEVLAALGRLGASRVVYVSCDPATLARDAVRLAAEGYRLEEVRPVDMFPRTAHVECVARFVREAHDADRADS